MSRWQTDPVIRNAVARLKAACGHFEAEREIARTGKSVVLEGDLRGTRAVAKVLMDRGEFWRSRLRNELAFYRIAAALPASITIPRMYCGDDGRGILILEYLDGRPLATKRYPEAPIDGRAFTLLLEALPRLHDWTPGVPSTRDAVVKETERRLERHVDRGLLARCEAIHARTLIRETRWEPTFNHRDLLFTNCLTFHDRLALIDWEYSGYALPGYDEALLWVLLVNDASRRDLVADIAHEQNESLALLFKINVMSLLAREIHMLRASGEDALQRRATTLATDLADVRRGIWTR